LYLFLIDILPILVVKLFVPGLVLLVNYSLVLVVLLIGQSNFTNEYQKLGNETHNKEENGDPVVNFFETEEIHG